MQPETHDTGAEDHQVRRHRVDALRSAEVLVESSVDMDRASFLQLVDMVERRAPLVGSVDHGAHHWRLVGVTGAELVATVPGADPLVVLLFALFHDSQRETDYVDPEHGPRGAASARELIPSAVPGLSAERLAVLCTACELHTSGGPTDDPTLGACWDSDRLNLWRVGIEPSPLYLSTDEAKRPERIHWAEPLQSQDFTWPEVFDAYF